MGAIRNAVVVGGLLAFAACSQAELEHAILKQGIALPSRQRFSDVKISSGKVEAFCTYGSAFVETSLGGGDDYAKENNAVRFLAMSCETAAVRRDNDDLAERLRGR